jgi:diguanylate cyclase
VHFDGWSIEIPMPVALAIAATLGYLVSRWHRPVTNEMLIRSRRDLKRAQAVAKELEKITWAIRQSLAQHNSCVSAFKDRVARLSDGDRGAAWKDLCQEAESILKPTLQLASQMASAYDGIRQQSANLMSFTEVRTDPLTGMTNRRGLNDSINAQLALMSRYHSVFSLAMFDIDHFKLVNDREGHLHGDRTLQELAQLLEAGVRETDVVARYGGEEFIIVMPQTDLAGACLLSERLRAEVADRLAVTVSGGVTAAEESDTTEALIGRADTALYSAKNAGRNRVFCHTGNDTQPVAEQESPEHEAIGIGSDV